MRSAGAKKDDVESILFGDGGSVVAYAWLGKWMMGLGLSEALDKSLGVFSKGNQVAVVLM